MPDEITQEERQLIRKGHQSRGGALDEGPEPRCTHGGMWGYAPKYPCQVVELLDALEAAEEERDWLRYALERIATQCVPEDHLAVLIARAALEESDTWRDAEGAVHGAPGTPRAEEAIRG